MYPCLLLKVLAEYDLQLCACSKKRLLCACVPVRFARGYTPRLHLKAGRGRAYICIFHTFYLDQYLYLYNIYIYTCVCMCGVCTCTHTHLYKYMHMYMYTCTDTHIHAYIPTYIPTYIHTYIHTCAHPHTYIVVYSCEPARFLSGMASKECDTDSHGPVDRCRACLNFNVPEQILSSPPRAPCREISEATVWVVACRLSLFECSSCGPSV